MTATVELSQLQADALEQLSRSSGKTRQDLMQDAINRLLEESGIDTVDWKAALRAGEGLWEHRVDLPDFGEVRRELDRQLW